MTEASNRLHQGRCANVAEALDACVEQYEYELSLLQVAEDEDGKELRASLTSSLEKVRHMRKQLAAVPEDEAELLEYWSQHSDEEIANIGRALKEGDFTRLAI